MCSLNDNFKPTNNKVEIAPDPTLRQTAARQYIFRYFYVIISTCGKYVSVAYPHHTTPTQRK